MRRSKLRIKFIGRTVFNVIFQNIDIDLQFSITYCFFTSFSSLYSLLFSRLSLFTFTSLSPSLHFLTSSALFTPLSYLLFSTLFFLIYHYLSIYFTTVHIFAFLVSVKIGLQTNFINFSYNIEIRKKLIINDIKNILL